MRTVPVRAAGRHVVVASPIYCALQAAELHEGNLTARYPSGLSIRAAHRVGNQSPSTATHVKMAMLGMTYRWVCDGWLRYLASSPPLSGGCHLSALASGRQGDGGLFDVSIAQDRGRLGALG
jgi:hypothetical protein